ncbi:DUF3325 domain-containing protein [Acinetobacter equi]|uniref:DUF3325 domain-containing protein n=1 Tax=Acinetobacter equi TaxID=1324350 RepID=A0A0N7GY37_9GAMM|nr:DUF3325 domain-containing protein [Acinetobacter equi]ALH96427.1 hypothetical protein AOY20_13245 [Acinetobacter equi]
MIFFLLAWSIATLGFIALASSMSKHQKQIFDRELSAGQSQIATLLGWFLLIISLIISLIPYTLSNGISYWVGVLTFSALFVGLNLSYYAHKMKYITIIIIAIALISAIICLL